MPVEGWNAQISLLTGMAAAHIMLYGQVGILRTMPPADPGSLRRLRQTAKALRIDWPQEMDYPDFVRALDPTPAGRGRHAHRLHLAVPRAPATRRSAAAYPMTPSTRPWRSTTPTSPRRCGGWSTATPGRSASPCARTSPVPGWVLRALDALPAEMAAAEQRAKKYERAIIDLVEVFLLRDRVGETFTGTVIDVERDQRRGMVHDRRSGGGGQGDGRAAATRPRGLGPAGQRRLRRRRGHLRIPPLTPTRSHG